MVAVTSVEALAEDLRRTAGEDDPQEYQARVDRFVQKAAPDKVVLELLGRRGRRWGRRSHATVTRQPVRRGWGALFLHRVVVHQRGRGTTKLLEKAVDSGSNEALFWSGAASASLRAHGEKYRCVIPLATKRAGSVTLLYFPYVAAVDQPRRASKVSLRREAPELVRAVAEFNHRNRRAHPPVVPPGFTRGARRPPSVERIQRTLGVKSRAHAGELRDAWHEIDEHWPALQAAYQALPTCLCHNDLTPGNVFYADGRLLVLDFGWASTAPIGSDLHTIIRWHRKSLEDGAVAEGLIEAYAAELRAHGQSIALEDLRRAAWTTFYVRYANLHKWSSARNYPSFTLALSKARSLLLGSA